MRVLILLGLLCLICKANAAKLNVAVASNFTSPMKKIAAEFEKGSQHTVRLSFGSSGKIYAQIQHGAPFDLFFSADQHKPQALIEKGLAIAPSRTTYAVGGLALWSAKTDLLKQGSQTLREGQFNKLALANPKLAPYGAAAVETLAYLKLEKSTQAHWVRGENIAQTFQFVRTGNADLGFVALSQILKNGRVNEGSAWIVPTDYYSPIRQDAVLLKRAADSQAAKDFLHFVKSEKIQHLIRSYGYLDTQQ